MRQALSNTTIADRLLFILLLGVSLSGILLAREAVSQASDVIVERDGKALYSFPVNGDRTVTLDGPYGDTVIEIHDRKVRVREAHCPNRICMKEGWISQGVIVCLPNRIVISVGSREKRNGKQVDAITG